ncbi:MAG: hypothetical protein ACREHE_15605 [Rhizomicrobium sp.]
MTATTIDITGYDNEDIDRVFTLKSGSANSSTPYDLTDVEFEADIRDQKNALVLRLTSAGDDGGIVITDAPNGVFQFHIAQGAIAYQANRSLRYDLLMLSGGETRRLWGGNVRVTQGVTVP